MYAGVIDPVVSFVILAKRIHHSKTAIHSGGARAVFHLNNVMPHGRKRALFQLDSFLCKSILAKTAKNISGELRACRLLSVTMLSNECYVCFISLFLIPETYRFLTPNWRYLARKWLFCNDDMESFCLPNEGRPCSYIVVSYFSVLTCA